MKRGLALLLLACSLFPSAEAAAQGIFDSLFGPDRAERAPARPARDVPRADKEKKRPDAAAAARAKKKGEAAKGQPETAAKTGASGGEAPPPPYEGQLVRLSEVLGALSFLRDLCQDKDGAEWREKMSALIEAEAPSGPRRDKYVAAFNRGFHGYELTYRACTQNAKDATARYLDEAAKISREVSYRFGSP